MFTKLDKHFDTPQVNLDCSNDDIQLGVISFFRRSGIVLLIIQIVTLLGSVSALVWAVSSPQFRDAEGFLRGTFCLPFAISVALMMWASALGGRFKESASWFALALVGQAAALQLIDAGPALRYQHYKPVTQIVTDAFPLIPLFIGVQTILVTVGLRTRWGNIYDWVKATFKTWQLLGISLLFVLFSVPVSRDTQAYAAELPLAVFLQCINLATIVLGVWSIPPEARAFLAQRVETLLGAVRNNSAKKVDRRFILLAATWVIVVSSLLSYFSYERHPHIADEVAYLLQARYLAAGMLEMQPPPVPNAFQVPLLNYETTGSYSVFPPGWPLALSVGVLLKAPWLVNPLLAGLNVLLSYMLIARLYDRRTARFAVLLLCISPWHILMSMNFMSHTFTLTCALAAALMLLRTRDTNQLRWAALAGAAVGLVSLIRPLDGVVLAALFGGSALVVGTWKAKLSLIAPLFVGCVFVGSLVLPYNHRLTGDPTVLPVNAYFDKYYWPKSNAFGFGPERGAGWPIDAFPGHSPLEGLINANLNTFSINVELFGWSTGSLLLVALLIFAGATRGSDRLMLAAIGLTFGAHFFYYFSGGPDFGARYWYLMLIPTVVLTVRGIKFLEEKLESSTHLAGAATLATVAVLALSAGTIVNYLPWRAIDKYHHYWGMRPDIRELTDEHGFGRSLVLIRGNKFPDYASAAVYNPVDLRADAPVFAWDQNAETRAQLLKVYEDRPVWVVDAPSVTGGGYKVIMGPLLHKDLLP